MIQPEQRSRRVAFARDVVIQVIGGDALVLNLRDETVFSLNPTGARIAELLPRSGFSSRFTAKGRFEKMMSAIPVKIIIHPQPGLFGAAVAFAAEHGQ